MGIKECDRCGALYKDDHEPVLVLYIRHGKMQSSLPLCPACTREIENWRTQKKRLPITDSPTRYKE